MSELGRVDTVTVNNADGTVSEVKLTVVGIAESPEPEQVPEPATNPEATPEP